MFEDDSTWHVRGPDPDDPDHYADGVVLGSDPDVRTGDAKGRAAVAKKRARAYITAQIKQTRGDASGTADLRHWKVRFTRLGMEPPMPFGKTSLVVCAASRKEAIAMVPASPRYPVTASTTTDPVSFTYRCRHAAASDVGIGGAGDEAKSGAQLDREISSVLGESD